MFGDMALDEIIKQIATNPAVAIGLVIMIVNWVKDTWGVNGKEIYLFATLPAAAVVSTLRYIGPYAVGGFEVGDWLFHVLLYGLGAVLGWGGLVKPILHKARGTRPIAQLERKRFGKAGRKAQEEENGK